MKKYLSVFMMMAMVVVGQGVTNPAFHGAQAKMLARRAAIVDVYKQTNGAPMSIISESFDGQTYTVRAQVN